MVGYPLWPKLAERPTQLTYRTRRVEVRRWFARTWAFLGAMSDIDLEEIEIVSFETAERKPEEAEVEMVEVRSGWRGVEPVRGGEYVGEYECEVQAPAVGGCDGRAIRP